jgi:hypothetical protein
VRHCVADVLENASRIERIRENFCLGTVLAICSSLVTAFSASNSADDLGYTTESDNYKLDDSDYSPNPISIGYSNPADWAHHSETLRNPN